MPEGKEAKRPRKGIVVAVLLIAVAAFSVLVAFVLNETRSASGPVSPSEDAYAEELAAALDGADVDSGAGLINEFECYTCHVLGDGSLSPLFDGIGKFASERRPPLSAEQYLYESIVHPGAFVVEGYSDSMPTNYDEKLSARQIGDMIVYMLTLTEEPPEF